MVLRIIGIGRGKPPVLAAVRFAWQIVPPASSATAGVTFTASSRESFYKYSESCNNVLHRNPQRTANNMDPELLINILGWTGSILYLLAYALVSMKKTEGDSLLYQGLNIVAGILVVIYTLALGAYATTGLNAVWIAIGLITLGRKWLTRN
jgi:hypothetical protein